MAIGIFFAIKALLLGPYNIYCSLCCLAYKIWAVKLASDNKHLFALSFTFHLSSLLNESPIKQVAATKLLQWKLLFFLSVTLTDQCSNLAPKTHFRYVSWSRICTDVYSTDSWYLWETDFSRNGNNLYKSLAERALNSGPFGQFKIDCFSFWEEVFSTKRCVCQGYVNFPKVDIVLLQTLPNACNYLIGRNYFC